MADEKVMENIAESEVQYDDAALAAEYLEKRRQRQEEDFKQHILDLSAMLMAPELYAD